MVIRKEISSGYDLLVVICGWAFENGDTITTHPVLAYGGNRPIETTELKMRFYWVLFATSYSRRSLLLGIKGSLLP